MVTTLVCQLKENLNVSQWNRTSILCYTDDIAIVCSSQDKVQQLTVEVLVKISAAKTKAMLMFGD